MTDVYCVFLNLEFASHDENNVFDGVALIDKLLAIFEGTDEGWKRAKEYVTGYKHRKELKSALSIEPWKVQ